MQSEKSITKQITTHLRSRGGYVVKIHGGPYQQPGLPDIVCILDGQTYWFEVKTEVGRLTRLQRHCHQRIRDHGGFVAVVRDVADVKYLLGKDSSPGRWKGYTE